MHAAAPAGCKAADHGMTPWWLTVPEGCEKPLYWPWESYAAPHVGQMPWPSDAMAAAVEVTPEEVHNKGAHCPMSKLTALGHAYT